MTRLSKGQLRLGVLCALLVISFALFAAATNGGGAIVDGLLVAEVAVAVMAVRIG
jgi:hypothetical protein